MSTRHATEVLGFVQRALLERCGVQPEAIGQVVGGCVTQIGEQSFNTTRMAWLQAGLPWKVAASTIDCQCGSSQQANHVVHNLIAAGAADAGIACGVELMSRVPIGANTLEPGQPKAQGFPYDLPHQFVAAERIAAKHEITREDADAYALESQQRAARASRDGTFEAEIVAMSMPVLGENAEGQREPRPDTASAERIVARDEGIRDSTADGLAGLRPMLEGGVHTPGNTSQISDGASAVLWMDERTAGAVGLRARARIRAQALVGTDPYFHIEGPIDATRALLRAAGMTLSDIDVFEINEAFAAVVLAWQRSFGVDPARVNINGGAIALGHPMGATGARLIATALNELERSSGTTALIAMCCGGAVATGTIIERV